MRAVRILNIKDAQLLEIPTPSPKEDEVLCKVVRAGICGTDYSIYTGDASFVKSGLVKFPMTPGHEWSGIVETVGKNVDQFKQGDRVVGDTCVSCGQCYDCLVGNYCHCKKIRAVGTIKTWDGGYAEYILMPARHLFRLPDNVSFDNGAMIEPAATALYSVVKAEIQIGESVLVLGSGPIGVAAAKLAKLCGASKVVVAARKQNKLDLAVNLGIDGAINTAVQTLADGVRQHFSDGKVDKVIEASGSIDLLMQTLGLMNAGGVISLVAFYEKPAECFDLDMLVLNDIRMIPVPGSLGMYKPVLKLMESGMLDLTSLINHRCALDQVPDVLADLKSRYDSCVKIMIDLDKKQ